MSTQDVGEEVLLNIGCIVKGYHLCRFKVNVGEVFTANKKRGERGNAFKVVNHRGQLQKESKTLRVTTECSEINFAFNFPAYLFENLSIIYVYCVKYLNLPHRRIFFYLTSTPLITYDTLQGSHCFHCLSTSQMLSVM